MTTIDIANSIINQNKREWNRIEFCRVKVTFWFMKLKNQLLSPMRLSNKPHDTVAIAFHSPRLSISICCARMSLISNFIARPETIAIEQTTHESIYLYTHCRNLQIFWVNASWLSIRNDSMNLLFSKPFSITWIGTIEPFCLWHMIQPFQESHRTPRHNARERVGRWMTSTLLPSLINTYLMHINVIGQRLLAVDQVMFHFVWNFKIGGEILVRHRHRCNWLCAHCFRFPLSLRVSR